MSRRRPGRRKPEYFDPDSDSDDDEADSSAEDARVRSAQFLEAFAKEVHILRMTLEENNQILRASYDLNHQFYEALLRQQGHPASVIGDILGSLISGKGRGRRGGG